MSIEKHGVETIELKWGQGAKCIGGEIKVNSLSRAIELKKRGYIVTPDPENSAHQAAFKAGPLKQFERHSRLGFIDQEGFMNEVERPAQTWCQTDYFKNPARIQCGSWPWPSAGPATPVLIC